MKIKSFECPMSIGNYENKIMLGTSDNWLMSNSSYRPSDKLYYIDDCLIYKIQIELIIQQNFIH